MIKKYKLLATLSLSLLAFSLSAQFVTIPDTKFAAYLDATVPAAMSGNQMDTTSSAVATLTRIYVENMGIKDLTGVQYFKSLITLDCGNGSPSADSNHLASLPPLPGNLDTLICGNNQLTSLPALPGTIKNLECYINHLTSLPVLPGSLTHLLCEHNNLTSLPSLPGLLRTVWCFNNQLTVLPVLPSTIQYIDCSFNQLSNLPAIPGSMADINCADNLLTSLPALPASLTTLNCSNNQLDSLPVLPGSMTVLYCAGNLLTSLPVLPGALQTLNCCSNSLVSLPALPATLGTLLCYKNLLTSLPALPATLGTLYCWQNQLTSLPTLPSSLFTLQCQNNNIYCFPVFPNAIVTIGNLNILSNPFSCLPNYVAGMDSYTLAYPLCAIGNVNGCIAAQGIVGYTYEDNDSNCIKDSKDSGLVNIPIQLYDSNNNELDQTYSAINGVYDFADTAGKYKVVIDTTGIPFMIQCPHPGVDSTVAFKGRLDTNINFSYTCKPGFDVGVQSIVTYGLIFPGLQFSLNTVAGDMSQWYNLNCAKGDSGTVQITVSGPVMYIGPAAGALTPSVAGNVFTYHIADYGAIKNDSAFNLILLTDTTAKAGDTICMNVTVTPMADNNPANNTYQYCYTVVNSHDPNIKETYPVNVAPAYSGWFTYTIHFQNTGTAQARNILILDTLDKNLDLATFQLINYSHQNIVHLVGNILDVSFHNINLPDSAASQKGSTGFVQYRVKPKPGLPGGTIIKNTGDIYFDHNPAIVTNTTQNIFTAIITSVHNIEDNISAKVFPNPGNGRFTIQLSGNSKSSVEVYNLLGERIYAQYSISNSQYLIDLTNQPAGLYFYRITTDRGKLVSEGKMIIE